MNTPAAQPRYKYVHAYLSMCRQAFLHTACGGTVKLRWNSPALDAAGWKREFLSALDNRINDKGGIDQSGRRWDGDYQRALLQDSIDLQKNLRERVRVYQWQTDIFRKRFPHLLSRYDD